MRMSSAKTGSRGILVGKRNVSEPILRGRENRATNRKTPAKADDYIEGCNVVAGFSPRSLLVLREKLDLEDFRPELSSNEESVTCSIVCDAVQHCVRLRMFGLWKNPGEVDPAEHFAIRR